MSMKFPQPTPNYIWRCFWVGFGVSFYVLSYYILLQKTCIITLTFLKILVNLTSSDWKSKQIFFFFYKYCNSQSVR